MAVPAALAAVKAAAAALADERGRKAIGGVIIAIISPVLLIIVVVVGMLSATADHNNAAIKLCFEGGMISPFAPEEYKLHIENMRGSFNNLETALSEIAAECEFEDGEPDMLRAKAVFYALFFGSDSPQAHANRTYLECFITHETRTRPCGDEDCTDDDCEEYEVAIPITELAQVYANVAVLLGRTITPEDAANITEIYYRVQTGTYTSQQPDSLEGGANRTHARIATLLADDETAFVGGSFTSPITADWHSLVTCEFAGYAGHTGIDMGIPIGTEIKAVAAGKVLYTKLASTGYGYHVVINHGGGFVTLYAHNSRILVHEGQEVAQGDTIALSGSTGRSTGPHLHLEFVIDGVPMNPRGYLP